MKTLRTLGALALVTSIFALAGCAGDESAAEPKTPEERIAEVESAIEEPSGDVSAESGPSIALGFDAHLDFGSLSAFFVGVPGLSGAGTVPAGCGSVITSGGSVDLACSSGGTASGKITFDVDLSAGVSGAATYVSVTLENACQGTTCLDGTFVIKASAGVAGASVIIDADFDRTVGGKTDHTHIGVATKSGVTGSSVDVVIFDEARGSFVVHTSAGATGSSIEVEGVNGSFSCGYESGGQKGSCTGAASFSW